MNENNKNNKSATMRLIIALCVTAAIAIVGWTTTTNLSLRMRSIEEIKNTSNQIIAIQQANSVRISVLENKYDNIQTTLMEIKLIVQKLREERD